ncbi:YjgP/YjgQ family permease|uniref:Lipopolysaccharide export system permease protein n=1 Tax=Dendrosporobacter quercicolus TaxID=146817 RepID=A0A1G9WKT2_9FIRM|nr:LptF/LptG family permease [Dendrosporobacter quercicolus]NSL49142.1 YjgP/YjgQ family permease [Dendrosporobacter quercicolus DSM 1736]SDM85202.1 lipopolysaccharide export system permease protein [Dendrosporobacter quercicolus]
MRILDKYIIKELLGPFVFGICAFSSVFIGTSTLFKIAQYITKYGASVTAVVKLFFLSLPNIVVLTFPMSMLLAALLAFGRLSGSSEITAMRSGGISFYRLTAPVLIVALFVSLFAVAFNEFIVPRANTAYNHIVRYEIERNTAPKSQEHIIIKEVKDGNIERLMYARKYDEATNTLQAISIQEFENGNIVRVQNAETAQWQNSHWIMYNGTIHDLSTAGNLQRTMKFEQQVMPITKNPTSIKREQKDESEMTIKELKQQIKVLQSEYVKSSSYEIELQQRVSIPLASFVFALIGAPLGLQPQRSSSSIGLGLSIIVIFIYYSIMTVTSALGQGGALPVIIAAWIPNITGVIAGCYLMRKAAR